MRYVYPWANLLCDDVNLLTLNSFHFTFLWTILNTKFIQEQRFMKPFCSTNINVLDIWLIRKLFILYTNSEWASDLV